MDNPVTDVGTQALIIAIVSICVSFLIFYLVIRAAVFAGLRDHSKWLSKRTPPPELQRQSLVPPQPPQQY